MDALKDLEQYVDESIKVFMQNMNERAGKPMNMGNWVQLFAFGASFEQPRLSPPLTLCRHYWRNHL